MPETKSHTNGKHLTLKEVTYLVDEDPPAFLRRVESQRLTGSVTLHFRDGRATKPVLWTAKGKTS